MLKLFVKIIRRIVKYLIILPQSFIRMLKLACAPKGVPLYELFKRHPALSPVRLELLDIGFRGGILPEYRQYESNVICTGFEADPVEAQVLTEQLAGSGHEVYPFAIGKAGKGRLGITPWGVCCSLKEKNPKFLNRLTKSVRDVWTPSRYIDVETVALDEALPPEKLAKINFCKIDVEGAEKDVIQGMEKLLSSPNLMGVEVEIWNSQMLSHDGSPIDSMAAVDTILRRHGFVFFSHRQTLKYKRSGFEHGYIRFYRERGLSSGGTNDYSAGQILNWDFLYLKDPVWEHVIESGNFVRNDENIAKMCMIYCVYGLWDCAEELLQQYFKSAPETCLPVAEMLESMCPPTWGGQLPSSKYKEFAKRFSPKK